MTGQHQLPPLDDREALRRHHEQYQIRLFALVREFLEVEGLTAQCCDFIVARAAGLPTPL